MVSAHALQSHKEGTYALSVKENKQVLSCQISLGLSDLLLHS